MKSGYQLGQEKKGILGGSQELFCILNVIWELLFPTIVFTLCLRTTVIYTHKQRNEMKNSLIHCLCRPWAWNVNVPHKWHWSIF